MAAFQYFVPGDNRRPNQADLDKMGVAYAFDGKPPVPCPCLGVGPSGGPGVTLAASDEHIGYYPDVQVWRPIPGSEKGVYVGHYNDNRRPTPEDLKRETMLKGHVVKMFDDSEWQAPVARGLQCNNGSAPTAYCALPRPVELDGDGKWSAGAMAERHKVLWDLAIKWFDVWCKIKLTDEGATFDFDEFADSAVVALSANYRIGQVEVGMLGIFDNRSMWGVLNALVDWPTFVEWNSKKKSTEPDGDGLSSTPGRPDDTREDTPQAART